MGNTIIHSLEPLTDSQKEVIANSFGSVSFLSRENIGHEMSEYANVKCLICRDRDDIGLMLKVCQKLSFLYVVSAGVEKLPFPELRLRGIVVCNAGGVNAEAMSQYAVAQILANSTKIRENLLCQQNHHWTKFQCVTDLRSQRLFIAGAGRSGTLLAKKAKMLGMIVIGASLPVRQVAFFDEVVSLAEFDQRINEADYVVCALPLTEQTERHFTYDLFCRMKSSACFVNMSRGGLVSMEGLVRALSEKRIHSATLDVFNEEPIASENALWDVPNLYVTPHMAGRIADFMDEAIRVFCSNYQAYLQGAKEPNRIDLENGF